MGFAAGEVLHGGAEGIGGKQADVDLHAAAHAKADFVFAAGDDVHQAGQFDDVIDQFLAFFVVATGFASYQDVEIADGLASAAERTGGRDFLDAGILAQMVGDLCGLGFGCIEEKTAGDAAIVLNCF